MTRKFTVLSLLSVLVVALGIAVPAYMNRDQPTLIGGPFHTPRPTSTLFSQPLSEIIEVVEVDDSQPETNDEVTNCTYPMYYWSDYTESWPAQIIIGGRIYTQQEMFRIYHAPEPDSATLLVRQLYTAFLNILGGAGHTRIDPIIVDANNWLETNPPGVPASELNQQIGIDLAAALEDYNDGKNGPPACDDVPPTPTASPVVTATLTPTPRNTSTPTRRAGSPPSQAQPPSNNQPAPPGAPIQPTATQVFPTPTQALPTTSLPTPTQPLAPPTAAPTATTRFVFSTATLTPRPPTFTNTPIPPTSTIRPPFLTSTPVPPVSTNTPVPPTNTPVPPSNTPVPPTSTNTLVPPTVTNTPIPPTQTDTPVPADTDTPTPVPTFPTQNPHYTPPTNTPDPSEPIQPPGSGDGLFDLDWGAEVSGPLLTPLIEELGKC